MHSESSPSTYWSPILYGRTYEVDFRMLAMPEYFDNEDRKWAEKYILPSMQNQNYVLENRPRWILITNEKYCVFASACMVEELFSEEQLEEVREYTLDKSKSRRLYAFIGYVAEKEENGQFPILPKFEEHNLELFQDTYLELVRDIWYCRNSQPEAKKPIITEADVSVNFEDYSSQVNIEVAEDFDLNFEPKSRLVCPENEQKILWDLSIEDVTKLSNHDLSVCLGLVSQKEAIKSPFLNSTCSNIERRVVLPVENKTRETTRQQSRNPSSLPTSERSYDRRETTRQQSRNPSPLPISERSYDRKKSDNQRINSPTELSRPSRTETTVNYDNYEVRDRTQYYTSRDQRETNNYEDEYLKKIQFLVLRVLTYISSGGSKEEIISKLKQEKYGKATFNLKNLDPRKLLKTAADISSSEIKEVFYSRSMYIEDINELSSISSIPYKSIEDFIIDTVKEIHRDYSNASEKLDKILDFIYRNFRKGEEVQITPTGLNTSNIGLEIIKDKKKNKESRQDKNQSSDWF